MSNFRGVAAVCKIQEINSSSSQKIIHHAVKNATQHISVYFIIS